jgi:solute carrier family 25 carnitine/acylcarnitine transporter 20/29
MHSEKRQSWYKEGALTALTGFLYGGSNTLVGHPFDTIKTKMQAESGHMSGSKGGPSYI